MDNDIDYESLMPDVLKIKVGKLLGPCLLLSEYGLDKVFEEFSNGVTTTKIAANVGIHRSTLWRLLSVDIYEGDPVEVAKMERRRQLWAEAKKQAAESYADRALNTAEDAPDTAVGVQKARLQVDTYKWKAATLHPEEYAVNKQNSQVQINLGDSFLESLKRRQSLRAKPEQALPSGDPDYEVGV